MQNCPRQLAMQSCVLCSFVRCGTSNQIERRKKKEKKKTLSRGADRNGLIMVKLKRKLIYRGHVFFLTSSLRHRAKSATIFKGK